MTCFRLGWGGGKLVPLLKEHWVVSRSRHPVAVSALTAALMALGPASSSVMPRCPALFILETWP